MKPFTLKTWTWKQGTFKTLQKKCSKITKKFPQHPYHGSNLNCIYWKLYWLERWQCVNSFSAPDRIQTEVVRNTKELSGWGGDLESLCRKGKGCCLDEKAAWNRIGSAWQASPCLPAPGNGLTYIDSIQHMNSDQFSWSILFCQSVLLLANEEMSPSARNRVPWAYVGF